MSRQNCQRRHLTNPTKGTGNNVSRQKQRQWWGQPTINQRVAAIVAAETEIVAGTEVAAVAAAAMAAMAAPTAAKAALTAAEAVADGTAEGLT